MREENRETEADELDAEIAEAEDRLRRYDSAACYRSFGEFCKAMWPVLESVPLEWSWHHDAMCLHAQALVEDWIRAGEDDDFRQRMTDLVVNVGPISLKSRIWMVLLPAWVWACRDASFKVFASSRNPVNVTRDSLACRDVVTSPLYREMFDISWSIREDQNRVGEWSTTAGGTRWSRGVGSSCTGVHADLVITDDPDDAAGVWSEADRRETWLFWQAAGNRLNDPRRPMRVVVQQNLMDQDLSTRLTKGTGEGEGGRPRLAIPVEWDESKRAEFCVGGRRPGTTPIGWTDPRTVDGQLVHAVRFRADYLEAERERLGSQGYEAQYNCDPSSETDGMFERGWLRFFTIGEEQAGPTPRPRGCIAGFPAVLPLRRDRHGNRELDLDWLELSVDATFGTINASSSAVGLLVTGGRGQARYVLDDDTKVRTFPGTLAAIRAMIAKWPIRRVLVEDKACGIAVVQVLRALCESGELLDADGEPVVVVFETCNPQGGKVSRAQAMKPLIEAGLLHLLDGAPWIVPFVGELVSFPRAKRDDRVDALSQSMAKHGAGGRDRWRKKR